MILVFTLFIVFILNVKKENILSTTNYGGEFTSAIYSDHRIELQFHPEKSHGNGL